MQKDFSQHPMYQQVLSLIPIASRLSNLAKAERETKHVIAGSYPYLNIDTISYWKWYIATASESIHGSAHNGSNFELSQAIAD